MTGHTVAESGATLGRRMSWVRRHPFATAIFAIILVIFALSAIFGADEGEQTDAILGLIIVYVVLVGLYALAAWLYGKIFRREEPQVPVLPVSPVSQQPVPQSDWSARSAMPASAPPVPAPPPIITAPSLGDLLTLTPAQFEELTLTVLVALGYTDARRSGGAGDLGADVVCRDAQGRSTIVQCKRYAPGSTIGTPDIQTFIGMKSVHHRADRGIFVTTVSYSQPAVDLARQHGIALIGGNDLLLLLHLTGVPIGAPAARPTVACGQCGATNPAGAEFCDQCGARLANVAAAPAGSGVPNSAPVPPPFDAVECPRCHTKLSPQVRFCTNCGLPRSSS